MVPLIAGSLAGLMIVVAALKGLRPGARWIERGYSLFTATWAGFAAVLYHPATVARLVPATLLAKPGVLMLFGGGVLLLAVYGANLLIGGGGGES